MKKRTSKLLSLLLTLTMVLGMLPAMSQVAYADYEDGAYCDYCGDYRWDDYLCSSGDHCAKDSSNCGDAHHCVECGNCGGDDEICTGCGKCYDCGGECSEGSSHECLECHLENDMACSSCGKCYVNDEEGSKCKKCGACSECAANYCEDCNMCEDCGVDEGTHCPDCYVCMQGEGCQICHRCLNCGGQCNSGCEDACLECHYDYDNACPDCGNCFLEGDAEQCAECGLCAECGGGWCDNCGMCLDCAMNNDLHCPDCEACLFEVSAYCDNCHYCEDCADICPDCGERCSECSVLCNNCGVCEDCTDICHVCGDYCSQCSDVCGNCGACGENCADICPECEDACSECSAICDDCGLCEDCCNTASEEAGCDHGVCVMSSDWDSHWEAEHAGHEHTHIYPGAYSTDADNHWKKCKICGDEADKGAHKDNLTHVPAKEATCSCPGNKEYYVCVCGMWFEDEDAGAVISDHKSVEIPALGHKESDLKTVSGIALTCTKPGRYGYGLCYDCGKCYAFIPGRGYVAEVTNADDLIKPALGHDWSAWIETKPATTAEEGEETRTCRHCKEEETRSIAKLGSVSYDIIVNYAAGGYAVASASTAEEGTTVAVSAVPDSGYVIGHITWVWSGGYEEYITDSPSFAMPAGDVTVDVAFKKAATYTINMAVGANGNAVASASTSEEGKTIVITAAPNSGYVVDEILLLPQNGYETDITEIGSFTMPACDVTVDVSFKDKGATTPIEAVAITGVTPPSVGATPTTAGITVETPNVQAYNILWADSDGNTVTAPFEEGKTYKIVTYLKPADGYSFAPTVTATVNGINADYVHPYSTTDRLVMCTIPMASVTTEIGSVAITGVTPPSVGATPTTAGITVETPNVQAYNILWADSDGNTVTAPFEEGKTYKIVTYLKPADGYSFAPTVTATVNGINADYVHPYSTTDRLVMCTIPFAGTTTYTVTFDANGHGTAPTAQSVESGKTATKPADPTETGWTFGGWYTEAACTNAFDFSTPITGAITLYAKWTKNGGETPTYYTVTFDANGHGTAPAAQNVESGKTATKPADPSETGWTFGGWYTEAACTNAFDFSTPITGAITLYAKWTKNTGGGVVIPTVFPVTVKESDNGEVEASAKYAVPGSTVKLTVTPDESYELDTLTVKSGSKFIDVTEKNGKYQFVMPFGSVTVTATFKKIKTPVVPDPVVPSFDDVAEDTYYFDAVEWAVENGITTGTSDTTFSPDLTCTRAQAVTFLWRAAGSPEPKSNVMPFEDVAAEAYYYKAVLWAVENGITKGTSATTFSPDADCTRAQIVTFLWRAQKSPAAVGVNPFTDVAADAYYVDAVLWAVEEKVTNGTSATTFSPDADCTRAQIVTFLYRALNGEE